jgi:D-xylose transport system permease protein
MSSTSESPPSETSPDVSVADSPRRRPGGESARATPLLESSEALEGTLAGYVHAWWQRARNGDVGQLPVILGLIITAIIFQVARSTFLSAGNLTNLLTQSAAFILFGIAEIFVLLLGEIDLSVGYNAAVGGIITAAVADQATWHKPWWVAIIAGLLATTLIGVAQGLIITLLRLPSFVVTLGGLLFFEGLMLSLGNHEAGKDGGGTISLQIGGVLYNLVNGNLGVATSWIILAVAVIVYGTFALVRDRRRASAGLVTPPLALTLAKILAAAIGGVVLVLICNTNRGRALVALRGVPWVVPIIVAVVGIYTFFLGRTRSGRYIYAIGGNAEAARRAGVSLTRVRVLAFALTGLTAGMAGIVYDSRQGNAGINVDGGQLVLYAVAAAVIGGTSLFGGRGKIVHALLGGLLIGEIYNGMGLLGLTSAWQYMITALVLLAAVTVDAVARRGNATR